MSEKKKIKVVWICHLMNSQIRSHCSGNYLKGLRKVLVERLKKKNNTPTRRTIFDRFYNMIRPFEMPDMAIWNTNAAFYISEYKDLEVHIVAPLTTISDNGLEYQENGIYYHFFHSQDDYPLCRLLSLVKIKLFNRNSKYLLNNRRIKRIVNSIKPDVVHLIGAECPDFAQSILKLRDKYPIIVQLQALLRFSFKETGNPYYYRLAKSEEKVLRRADYIGTSLKSFKDTIISDLNIKGVFINTSLALTEEVNEESQNKLFDFVYFANNLNKAFDLAIESFAIAHERYPHLTLDILGGSSTEEMMSYLARVKELGLESNVFFEGKLPTHDDVIQQIRLARYALLPLKTDYISGTIREAMSNGLPVVTTITEGTPSLNRVEPCVLLSQIGDHQALADNMIKLIEEPELSKLLVENSYKKSKNRISNKERIEKWHDSYTYILNHFFYNEPIPEEYLLK